MGEDSDAGEDTEHVDKTVLWVVLIGAVVVTEVLAEEHDGLLPVVEDELEEDTLWPKQFWNTCT